MPYEWFDPPKTIRLDTEFGQQQMVYRELADDAARDLANGINHLINLVARLAAWQKVIESLDLHEKNELLVEFVQDLASTALLTPYTIKARFYLLSHTCPIRRIVCIPERIGQTTSLLFPKTGGSMNRWRQNSRDHGGHGKR